VPRDQLASRHEGSSSGSNDPIGDLEARVEQLQSELHCESRARAWHSHHIAELSAKVHRSQHEIAERDTAIHWAVNSCSFAWDCEAKALARVAELNASLENLQAYCNTLHEEVHMLYDRLHPNMPSEVAAMGAKPSGTANEGPNGGLDILRPPPSMNLADERSPEAGSGAARDEDN
jgi:chromosome segregation ATPase